MTESEPSDQRITLPAAPQPNTPFRFPVVAATVPVVASVAIWLITGSMFALIFAALGPLAAMGSYVDSRVSARKKSRTETARFLRDAAITRSAIDLYHRRESVDLAERTPPAISLVRDAQTDSSRWMRDPGDVQPVHLGYGRVRSSLALDRPTSHDNADSTTSECYSQLLKQAASLQRAPIAVNARLGIVIFGNQLVALSLARALALQLARALSPTTSWVRLRGVFSEEQWGVHLPHRVLRSDGGDDAGSVAHEQAGVHWGQLGDSTPSVSISVVTDEEQAPSGHRIVIRASGGTVCVVGHPDKHQRREFEPSFLGREQALAWALVAHHVAARDGIATSDASVPESLEFCTVLAQLSIRDEVTPRRAHSLQSRPAVGASGHVVIDLVANGPHAIVGGTTGSGKSELLIAWVLAMAAEASPDDVTFLLVDFKGGSAFGHLVDLPHTVGIITDLDETAASRAFASLRAELQYRERALSNAGARDISELNSLPRLVIVVDEFAAMMADYPQLHALFSDIAARGRSLGMHLILCTQRPSGVVRDSLLANADLRISLRVNNGADSSAVIGSDRAAELPADPKGRAWMAHGSSSATLVQFALATPDDVRSVSARWPGNYEPRRPWCEPLGDNLSLATLALSSDLAAQVGDSVIFGLIDLPKEQRHGIAEWSPSGDGHIFILGAPGSGKSTALATLASVGPAATSVTAVTMKSSTSYTGLLGAQGDDMRVIAAGREPSGFWDAIADVYTLLDRSQLEQRPPVRTLLMIDDLDAIISRFEDDHRAAVTERLVRVLREGPAHNIWVLASAQRVTPALQSLAQLMPNMLRLRFDSKQDFVLSGGTSADYLPALPPGGGLWKGARVQIAVTKQYPPSPAPVAVTTLERTDTLVVASSRPASTATVLAAAGWSVRTIEGASGAERQLLIADADKPTALIGSIDEWQSRWGALTQLRAHATVLLDGCSLSDYRQLARSRELPPPLISGARHYWRITEDGADRVQLPLPESTSAESE